MPKRTDYQDHLGNPFYLDSDDQDTPPPGLGSWHAPVTLTRSPPPETSLAMEHARLATAIASKFRHRASLAGIAWPDLYQTAQAALADVARRYDPARGQFSTFAGRRIEGAIKDAIEKSIHAPCTPSLPVDEWPATYLAPGDWVAESAGHAFRELGDRRGSSRPVADGDDLFGVQRCGKPPRAWLPIDRHDRLQALRIPEILNTLDPLYRDVVCRRFGLGRPEQTIRSIAWDLGVSVNTVSSILDSALDVLRFSIGFIEAHELDESEVDPLLKPILSVIAWHLTRETHQRRLLCEAAPDVNCGGTKNMWHGEIDHERTRSRA